MPSVTFSRIPRAASVVAERKGLTKMGKASARLKLMYVEGDEEVLKQHALTLEKAGHHVTSIVGRKDAMEQLKLDAFDLVVLGQTLSRNDRHHLPYMVKKFHQGTRVLVMHTDGERHPYVDANLDTGSRIEQLMEKIANLEVMQAV
jgi:ActR/RegA family two-component response regulator